MSKILGVLRATLWILLMMSSGCILTVALLLASPVVRLFDPLLASYQRIVGFFARLCLRPFVRVTVKVRSFEYE